MKRTITAGVSSGGIVIVNYDEIEKYFDPMGMRHMDGLCKYCIDVGLFQKVIVDVGYSENECNDVPLRLRMNSDGSQSTRMADGGRNIIAKLNVGPSGMIYIGDPTQFCVEKRKELPLYPKAVVGVGNLALANFIDGWAWPLAVDAFYKLDVTISDGRGWCSRTYL